ncbi:MAG: aminopeptidase P N-terminal domain-containing protein [Polyangiaceae bacterium]|nr:aminopeptidase P N-terminal domain-containing protein [Polyangiaceae bacterium]
MKLEFSRRREQIFEQLGEAVLIVPGAPVAVRNNDVEHDYRQSSDLQYVSGFVEPHSVAVLKGGASPKFYLFVQKRDPEREIWDGRRAGPEGAQRDFGADEAFEIEQLESKLVELLENTTRLYYRLGVDSAFDRKIIRILARVRQKERRGIGYPTEIVDLSQILHEMRLFKSNLEIECMEKALEITGAGHAALMAMAAPGKFEYELEAELNHVFRQRGCERHAYSPIVGSGPNATILHYRENNRCLEDGDLVLVDAGCEYGYYASDITRTFPANGRFTAPQRELYELVLEAQLAAIAATKPGTTLGEIHDAAVRVTAAGLIKLGLLKGTLEKVLEDKLYLAFFMHKTSHYLGMDVHDVGAYQVQGKPRTLAANMVITVEPGLYVAAEPGLVPEKYRELYEAVPDRYRGIGIRIEDDVLVTANGSRVLSPMIPKTVEDVEAACRG